MQANPAIGPAAPARPVQIPQQMMHGPPAGGLFAAPPPPVAASLSSGPPPMMHPYLHPGNSAVAPIPVAVPGAGGATVAALVPEEQWAALVPGPFSISVVATSDEGAKEKGWKLDGATHTLQVDSATTVEQIKQMLEVRIGIPPSLQKLKHATKGFLKDKDSCAFYNLRAGDTIELTRQQRGGKKK
jgi:hypothetical protein